MSFINAVRNPDGLFINVKCFSEEASHFQKYGYYCADLPGTPGHYEYWQEQMRRCTEGYTVGGTYITPDHYAYLNFFPIRRVVSDQGEATSKDTFVKSKSARKIVAFPDFYDGDYNFFHVKDIAKNGISKEDYEKLHLEVKIRETDLPGGKHLGVGKARRKGYSFKNAAICANTYNTVRDSITLIGAYEKKFLYPEGTMGMTSNYLNWLNSNTAWTKRQIISRMDHIKAGYEELINGVKVTRGFKSQIIAVTFKDNPDAARGKDATLILLDEAGKFPNLKDVYLATKPTVESGIYTTGLIIFFGTGGKDNDDWADFSEMFNNPDAYNCIAFENIWEDGNTKPCGFFHPDYVTKDGFVDQYGNSLRKEAIAYEEQKRENLRVNAKEKTAYTQHLIEYPFTPKEAFSLSAGNIFPAADLISHRNWLESQLDDAIEGIRGEFTIAETGKPVFQADPHRQAAVFPVKHGESNTDGCWVLWEQPVENPPYGLYVAGTDPYNKDKAPNSVSMGSTFIIKRAMLGYDNHDKIVAEYTGRPLTAEAYYEGVRRGLIYYNAINLYENNVNGMKMHFQHQNSLQYLAYSPNVLKANANTSVARTYGLHMTKGVKDELELLTSQWLSSQCGEGRMNLQNILSIPLLNELIMYNEENNFDRAISLMLAICQKFQMHQIVVKQKEQQKRDPFWDRKLFSPSSL